MSRSDETKRYRAKYPDRIKEYDRKKAIIDKEILADKYVKSVLKSLLRCRKSAIPKSIVESYRLYLMTHRLINKMNHAVDYNHYTKAQRSKRCL